MRQRDHAYEALANETQTDWKAGRGELNTALLSIRGQMPVIGPLETADLAHEIRLRAKLYRQAMPEMMLTPTALAKHWSRLPESARSTGATNQSSVSDCETCGGDRFVLYATRTLPYTAWMREHGIKEKPPEERQVEEYAPCPCNSALDASYRRYDGRVMRVPDPAAVRDTMVR